MNIKKLTGQLLQDMMRLEQKQQKIEKKLSKHFTLAEQLILNYEVSIGRKESVLPNLNEEERIVYSNMCQGYLNFGNQVEDCLAHVLPMREAVRVCSTPQLLVDIGLEPASMHITQRHLTNCMRAKSNKNVRFHGLTKEEIKRIPEALENPAMIAESLTREQALVVVLGYRDRDELPVIVSIAPGGKALYQLETVDSNFITSVYGRSNIQEFVNKIVEQDKLLYINKEKSMELALLPLQLRQGHPAPAFNSIIRRINDNVNEKTKVESSKTDVSDITASVKDSPNIKV